MHELLDRLRTGIAELEAAPVAALLAAHVDAQDRHD
jgi:hypothetical protein